MLSGPLTAETVVQTRQQMLALLDRTASCTLRAGEVTQLDGAGAQLLHAWFVEVARRGGAVQWASASIYLVEAARMLGMEGCLQLLGLPPEVTSCQP